MSTIQPMTQTLVPAVGTGNRILGTVALDIETTFDGTETTVSIQGTTQKLAYFAMTRVSDGAPINYMGIPVTATEERDNMQQHIPDFGDVTSNTPKDIWKQPSSQVIAPVLGTSTWERFLASLPPQDRGILPPLRPLMDA